MKFALFLFILLHAASVSVWAQQISTPNFRVVVEKRLKHKYKTDLAKVCAIDSDVVAERVFRDYGAIFVSNGSSRIPNCLLDDDADVQAFQLSAEHETTTVGGVPVTLQTAAMKAFLEARAEALKKGLAITPRGGSEASTRSYSKTVDLWRSRFLPGLTYWTAKKRIKSTEAAAARQAPILEQVAMVLEWEKKGIFFSTDKSKSILYSVALPGASQHCFMLALDVEQFANSSVRRILAAHGWFQTVKSDLPHFTYLGVTESELPSLGLTPVTIDSQKFWIPNM